MEFGRGIDCRTQIQWRAGGSIDLNLGLDAVIRHARYLPPHGSRTPKGPSAASSFSSGGSGAIIATSRPGSDVRLQCVLNRSGGAACIECLCMLEGGLSPCSKRHSHPKSRDHEDSPLTAKGGWRNYIPKTSAFVISNDSHDYGLSGHSAETTGTGFVEARMSHGDAQQGQKTSGSHPDEDGGPRWGSGGAECKGNIGRGDSM